MSVKALLCRMPGNINTPENPVTMEVTGPYQKADGMYETRFDIRNNVWPLKAYQERISTLEN